MPRSFTTSAALFLLAVWLSVPAFGTPATTNVTGTLTSGSTLTVTGSLFGTKGVAAPLKFDTFEGGTLGNQVANGWTADGASNCGAPIHRPVYSNTVLRTNSTKSVQCRFDEASDPGCGGDGAHYSSSFGIASVPNPGLPVLYMDGWCHYAPPPIESRNVKLIRVHTAFNGSPNLFVNIYCAANGDGMRVDQSVGTTAKVYGGYDNCGIPGNCTLPWHGESWWEGSWRHIQLYLVQSSPGGNDGTVKMWTDGVLEPNQTNWNNRSTTTFWDTAFFGNYVGHDPDGVCTSPSPGNTFIYWDDAYVDTTLAHVEIGNASTYSTCTQREIQPVTSWSSSSIQITANQGGFASLTGKYLYVIDRTGAVNTPGFALTGGHTPVLAQPSDMTVNESATSDQSISATDSDGDPLAFTKVSGPTFLTVTTTAVGTGTGTGNIHLAPGAGTAGTYAAQVRASDGTNTDQKSLLVTVSNITTVPVLAQPSNMTCNEGSTCDQTLNATEADHDPITFSMTSLTPIYMLTSVTTTAAGTGTATGNIHLAPSYSNAGTYTMIVRATDNEAAPLRNEKTLTITINNVNQAPTLYQPTTMIAQEGTTADQTILGWDPDGDGLTFSKVSGNALATVTTLSATTGNIHIAPIAGDAAGSPYSIVVRASDGTLTSDKTVSVTVTAAVLVGTQCSP